MTTQKSDIHSTIRTITDRFEETFSDGDLDKLAEFYSDNGLLLPAGFDFIKGRQDIGEFWQSARGDGNR
jgi:ketosteroid isomerase-like protein